MVTKQSGARPAGRKYHGLTPQQRTRQRRAAILAAGLEVFGTLGYAGSSVKQICRVGGLTERYFYESFTDRESCLAELYSHLVDQMRAATLAAVESADTEVDAKAQAGLNAFIGYLTDDPRRARVVLIEVVGVSPGMEKRRHRVLREFADIVATTWAASRTEPLTQKERSTAVALVGAVNHLLVDWLMTGSTQHPTDLADVCATLFSAARQRLDAARPSSPHRGNAPTTRTSD
jgi:AcrR family transcriptional regulator